MDYPDYKYQPRRKKMKSMSSCGMIDEKQDADSQHQVPPSSKKSGRRSKKQQLQQQMENGEMDDNSSEKGLVIAECDNMSYGVSNYDNRSSLIPNYSAFASYMPPTMSAASGNLSQENAVGSFSSPHNQNNNYNDFYMHHRKYSTLDGMHLGGSSKVDSPHSSADEHSPETSISSASALRPLSPAPPLSLANGNFRESLSPSLISSHAILKEDYTTGNDCASNKDLNVLSKYNQDSAYRIYSHQLHHHHHYHYPLLASTQTPSSSSSSSSVAATSPINYAYQGYSASSGVGIADTDVDPKEMEQYLASDSGRYKKFCYMKPEMPSLTELTPMNSLSSSNESYHSHPHHHQAKIDNNENLMQMPTLEPIIIAPNQPTTYVNGYQENLPSSAAYSAYMNSTGASNWINY